MRRSCSIFKVIHSSVCREREGGFKWEVEVVGSGSRFEGGGRRIRAVGWGRKERGHALSRGGTHGASVIQVISNC